MDRIKFYGTEADGAMLAVCTPYNEEAKHCGNGTMVSSPGGLRKASD